MLRRCLIVAAVFLMGAPVVLAQGVTSFTGGTQYPIYHGGSTGDVIGFRFTVGAPLEVDQLGVWNADTATGAAGLTSTHQVGIWDQAQTLVASVIVDPATGTPIGQWTYAAITPVTLMPGQTYTAGALYTATDNDSYISGATSLTTDPNVTWVQSVYPAALSLGFVFPANNSTSNGRFGPNFIFTVVPVELQTFSVE